MAQEPADLGVDDAAGEWVTTTVQRGGKACGGRRRADQATGWEGEPRPRRCGRRPRAGGIS